MSLPVSPAPVRRWPLALIACPAAVAIWSGWVGLGGLCGFGPLHPLPGLVDGFTINTAITLPIGVEAYGAYALRAWLAPGAPESARDFARFSAIGALALGMCGQVIYHLLSAVHATRAPWPVVVLVSCIPVATLGMAAALTHMLAGPAADETLPSAELAPGRVWVSPDLQGPAASNGHAGPGQPPGPGPARAAQRHRDESPAAGPGRSRPGTVTYEVVAAHFAAELAAGRVPSGKEIRRVFTVGSERASQFRALLQAAAARAGERGGLPEPVSAASS